MQRDSWSHCIQKSIWTIVEQQITSSFGVICVCVYVTKCDSNIAKVSEVESQWNRKVTKTMELSVPTPAAVAGTYLDYFQIYIKESMFKNLNTGIDLY